MRALCDFDVLASIKIRINLGLSIHKYKRRHTLKDKSRHLLRYSSFMTGAVYKNLIAI